MADQYDVQVNMNGGPFDIEKNYESTLTKSDLSKRGSVYVVPAN